MDDKQLVALHAARQVKDGMLVGLGTGSTANYFIEELARRQREEGLKITAISSSVVSAVKAQSLGLPLLAIEQLTTELEIAVILSPSSRWRRASSSMK